jgi:beta-galactosidase/beta-glucuronidase
MSVPRPEYPRPQFVRQDWLTLNGEWEFEIDQGNSGIDRDLLERPLNSKIIVPFAPESELSGVHNRDYLNAVWYRREVTIPAEWAGKRTLLNFQAVDYDTTVWANGVEVARHRGGSSPIVADLSQVAQAGETVTIVVRARDTQELPQPRGKQSRNYGGYGAIYIRTTGIWQSVWLEPVSDVYLKRTRITPNVGSGTITLVQPLSRPKNGLTVRATLSDAQGDVVTAQTVTGYDFTPQVVLAIPEDRRRLWSIDDPHLYDLKIELLDASGAVIDSFQSYAGLRSLTIDGKAIRINGKVVFQRLVLDQGYYPDGVLTAPSEQALIDDIRLSMEAGFNGARLHQKVFEERFLYHCDKMGYIVWGEFPDWGCREDGRPENDHQMPTSGYITEWLEVIERDYSHPAIVGWCPLNETWQTIGDTITDLDVVTRGMFLATKAMDQTRPVLDVSGYSHRVNETDVYDSHDYTQDPAIFAERQGGLSEGKPYINAPDTQRLPDRFKDKRAWSLPYDDQPYFCSEFGGIRWNPDAESGEQSWGYGEAPRTIEEFHARFEGLCNVLLQDPDMFGYCYTQLTDVFQEQNGIYRFDRSNKLDIAKIRAVQTQKAAIEAADE